MYVRHTSLSAIRVLGPVRYALPAARHIMGQKFFTRGQVRRADKPAASKLDDGGCIGTRIVDAGDTAEAIGRAIRPSHHLEIDQLANGAS